MAWTRDKGDDEPATAVAFGFVKLSVAAANPAIPIAVGDNDARMTDSRPPAAHATSHQPGGSDAMAVDAIAATGSLRTLGTGAQQALAGNTTIPARAGHLIKDEAGAALTQRTNINFTGAGVTATDNAGTDSTDVTIPGGGAGSTAFTAFTQDLGAARQGGTFDLTGLSGLTIDKPVMIMQTSAAIASKGNARDEPEMDHIAITGHVKSATEIRCYWNASAVVVGIYAFAYLVGA